MTVRITEDGPWFGKQATVIDLNPVPGSTQAWLDVDGVRVVVARHDLSPAQQCFNKN